MVRSELPRFIWSLRKNQVDFQNLQKDQIINHHSGAPFTTKVNNYVVIHLFATFH